MSARVVMVQGTASSVGKSVLVTGLCRSYSRKGLRVAPFKAQNMALNSFVTPDGGEIGRSQAVQAEACGAAPSVFMNPVLLKPNSDFGSQVIVNGRVLSTMDAKAYYAFRHTLRPAVMEAFASLAANHDLVVIEGAGSPAEINLRENDLVNMGMAVAAQTPVILISDIDRGGVFASLYGTAMLLEPAERAHIKGMVINKFRGDPGILEPGLRRLAVLLGIPVLGVLPYWDIRIDEEDSLAERLGRSTAGGVDIAVAWLPRLSNFTDFGVFDLLPDTCLRYVKPGEAFGSPDMVILPGSKSTIRDMRVLRDTGMADAILAYHASGGVIAGICGGFQMLGSEIADPDHVESDVPCIAGLGLLDVATVFEAQKRTVRTRGAILPVPGVMRHAAGLAAEGYEIRMGRTRTGPAARPLLALPEHDGAVSSDGRVFGTYLHGLFDSIPVARVLVNALRERKNLPPLPETPASPATCREYRLAAYDRLADTLEEHLDMRALDAIIEKGMQG